VFVPVAFMQGITGKFFRQFGLTITVAVLISLFVAFTLDPMLSARLARARPAGLSRREPRALAAIRAAFEALDRLYARTLGWVLRHRALTFAAAVALFAGSVAVGGALGSEFAPKEDRNQLIVNLEYPPGTSLAATAQRSGALERRVQAIPGVVAVYATLGYMEDARMARWRVNLVDKNERAEGIDAIKDRVRAVLAEDERLRSRSVSDPPMLEGLGDVPPILMHVTGRDFAQLAKEADFMVRTMRSIPALADIELKDSPGRPELHVTVDRDEAARLGIPAGAVALQVRLATEGEIAGKLREGRRESEIRVRLAADERGSERAIGSMWIATPKGRVALAQLATLGDATSPAVIEHQRRERKISVWAQIAPGHDMGSAARELRARLEGHPLPPGYAYIWDGMQKEQVDSQANMGLALTIAVVFIFIVLASQFESIVHPFTIMLSLPLAIVGAFLALFVTGRTVSLGSLIGLILLMGLVTKNAILLVDGALQHMRDGDGPEEAVRKAGPRRLRPILMTSAAMVLGMLPTALGRGMGSEFRSPMAIAVIGGVITSTMLTLWVVPVVFVWVERVRREPAHLLRWALRRPRPTPAASEARPGADEEATRRESGTG
jgi:HAE1 family hydrophobic/amphiphilic exporter-1